MSAESGGAGSRSWSAPESVETLAFALCHEVGNWLAAVRLQAHLLPDDLGPRELAAASLEIDELCARASAMLSQLRPLLCASPDEPGSAGVDSLLEAVRSTLADQGTRQATLEVDVPSGLPRLRVHHEQMHPLLTTLSWGAMHAMRDGGVLRLDAIDEGEFVAIRLDDGTPLGEPLDGWRNRPLRGRPLTWALAEAVLEKLGGRLEVTPHDPGLRVTLRLPAEP